MEEKEVLYGYKMTHDTGFAPNPYHGVLTLATCKPLIRKWAREGYWISGWTSNVVFDKEYKKHCFTDDSQKLIYLAKVKKVITFDKYWNEDEKVYSLKKQPTKSIEGGKGCFKSCANIIVTKNDDISFCGDNIYEPDVNEPSGFKQHENPHHGKKEQAHDLSGKHVLVCEDFYYFGVENAIFIEKEGVAHRWKKFSTNEGQKIIDYVTKTIQKGFIQRKYENSIKQKRV